MIKKIVKSVFRKMGYSLIPGHVDLNAYPVDFEKDHQEIAKKCAPFTMTSREKIYGLVEAVKYIEANNIDGDIVECGVWRGGSMMAVIEALKRLNSRKRTLYMYDTYEGMSEATKEDIGIGDMDAEQYMKENPKTKNDLVWAYSPLDEVKANIYSTGYDQEKILFVKGKVEDTIPDTMPDRIAILRLDTDWYESTKHEMENLFPRLAPGGILILDDYGHWLGAKKAVDEYVKNNNIRIFLARLDYSGRIAVKQ